MSTLINHKIDVPAKIDLNIITSTQHDLWAQATGIEAEVFIEKEYVASAIELEKEYEPYLPSSEFILARLGNMAIGSVRCITGDSTGFKTVDDIEKGRLELSKEGSLLISEIPMDRMLEIGTLAVASEWRSQDHGRAAVQLYGAILGYMNARDLTHVLASFDEDYFNNFKIIFGGTVDAIGPAVDYMGSPTVPAIMNVYDMHEHTRGISQELYDTIQEASNNVH